MKPNQGLDLRGKELETDITDGNRAIHSSEWMETDLHKSQPKLSLLRKRVTPLKGNGHFGENDISATGEKIRDLRETEIDTTLETKHFGGMSPETRPPGRRYLGNKKSTIHAHSSEWIVVTTTRQPPAEAGKGADIPPG